MSAPKNDILQGTLSLLVLKTLASQRRLHGYAITTHIQQVSDELLRVEEGSLYPALHRMEQLGWLRSEWGTTYKNRDARFYSLTAKGRKQLELEEESWSRLTEVEAYQSGSPQVEPGLGTDPDRYPLAFADLERPDLYRRELWSYYRGGEACQSDTDCPNRAACP